MRWVGLPVASGGLILMNPAAVTVLGHYHDAPCIEHANVVPLRGPLLAQPLDDDEAGEGVPVGAVDSGLGHA